MPDHSPLHKGRSRPAVASMAVTGGQLVRVSGASGIYPTIAPMPSATSDWYGVAGCDAPPGAVVTIETEGEQILKSAGAITAGYNVEGAAGGTVAQHTNGTNDVYIVGVALTTVTGAGQNVTVRMLR